MPLTTYENRTRYISIHRSDCGALRQHGSVSRIGDSIVMRTTKLLPRRGNMHEQPGFSPRSIAVLHRSGPRLFAPAGRPPASAPDQTIS